VPRAALGGIENERFLHENHWESEEVTIKTGGVAGQELLGEAVPEGKTRRIRELTIRHTGTNNTVVTLVAKATELPGTRTLLSIDVPAESTITWSSQDGREIMAGEQAAVQSSDVTGGSTFVSAAGVEA